MRISKEHMRINKMVLLKIYLLSVILFVSYALGSCEESKTIGNNNAVSGYESVDENIHLGRRRRIPTRTCRCDANIYGACEVNKKTGKYECHCNPGSGIYESSTSEICQVCHCGNFFDKDYKRKSFGCIFEWGLFSNTKRCFCDAAPGYYEENGLCTACLCGERYDGVRFNCTSPSTCYCGIGYKRVLGKCKPSNVCSLKPCLNNGTCIKKPYNDNGFECNCLQGFHGKLCEKVSGVAACAKEPCKNGGSCVNISAGDGYTCRCQDGFKGKKCEETVFDACSLNPCFNNGTCIRKNNDVGFECECRDGFKGSRCETCDCKCSTQPK